MVICMSEMREHLPRKETVQKLLQKILVWKFMGNMTRALKQRNLTHTELSKASGRVSSAFNKTINQVEDLRLSSFLRYWVVISELTADDGLHEKIVFEELIDEEIRRMIAVLSDLSYEDQPSHLLISEREFFIGLRVHVEGLKKKHALGPEESETYELIAELCERID